MTTNIADPGRPNDAVQPPPPLPTASQNVVLSGLRSLVGRVAVVAAAYSGACWLALFADTAFFSEGAGPLETHPGPLQALIVLGLKLTPVVLLVGLWQLSARVRRQNALIRAGASVAEAKRLTRGHRSVLKLVGIPLAIVVAAWLVGVTVLLIATGGRIPF